MTRPDAPPGAGAGEAASGAADGGAPRTRTLGHPAARWLGGGSWVALALLALAVVATSLRMDGERAWNYPREIAGLGIVHLLEGAPAIDTLSAAMGGPETARAAGVVRAARLVFAGPGESAAAWVVATRRARGADRLVAAWSARFAQEGAEPAPFLYRGRPAAYAVDGEGEHFLVALENLAFWVTVATGEPQPRAMEVAQALISWPYRVGNY